MPYYKSQMWYVRGERVHFGNWGRTIFGIGPAHNRFYPEYLLEKIRQLEFPNLPSRMRSSFVFENRDFALNWNRIPGEHTYLVCIDDNNAISHRGDMGWIDLMVSVHSFDEVEDIARRYWRGEVRNQNQLEIVVPSELIIEERIA